MNLDDPVACRQLDSQYLFAQIEALPDLLQNGWGAGAGLRLPAGEALQGVLIAGMGSSAASAELLAAYVAPTCRVPVAVHCDYGLPAWARGSHILVIALSHSGDTEETLSAFESALDSGCCCLAITGGGALAARADESGATLWTSPKQVPPPMALGFRFGLLLAAFSGLGLIPRPTRELEGTVAALRAQAASLGANVPVARNPAKRLAGQLVGRGVLVFGSGILAPVARVWKGQINEIAKAWGQYEMLPEADHNTLAGSLHPEELLTHLTALFLRSPSDDPRNRLRSDLTRRALMLEGLSTDFLDAQGDTRLAHQWTALQFGEYAAYYLALAYGTDPAPAEAIAALKEELQTGGD